MNYAILGIIALLLFRGTKFMLKKADFYISSNMKNYKNHCKTNEIKQEVVNFLNKVQKDLSFKLKDFLTSGYRCLSYNNYLASVGYKTAPTSSHIKGLAWDVAGMSEPQQKEYIIELQKKGCKRILAKNDHIHADLDSEKNDYLLIPISWKI